MATQCSAPRIPDGFGIATVATLWRFGAMHAVLMAVAALLAVVAFWPALRFMAATWTAVQEYSHGWFMPVLAAFIAWQRSDRLRAMPLRGAWSGLWLVALGLAMGALGELSAVRVVSQFGFVVAVAGAAACAVGWAGVRVLALPLLLLLLMVPWPQFALREISQALQLVSSQLGVGLIRAFGISVFVEGNIIDLGSYQLQVADACSGLRYLFPLFVLGCLVAYLFDAPWWARVLVVVSTVPLSIVVNGLRIGLVGVTVEHWGSDMAEGLLHDVEGWFVFMVCLALLLALVAVLARLLPGPKRPLREVFGLTLPDPLPGGTVTTPRTVPRPLWAATAAFALAAMLAPVMAAREPVAVPRLPLAQFPMDLPGGWEGRPEPVAAEVLEILAVDDHLMRSYLAAGRPPVNLYVAWYASQGGGQSSHSPRTCLPGGGWRVAELRQIAAPFPAALGAEVNQALIEKGDQRQLVLYWFQQRGRTLADELAVKWHILADGLLQGRSDGALVRLVTPVAPGEDLDDARARLQAFAAAAQPLLLRHVPD